MLLLCSTAALGQEGMPLNGWMRLDTHPAAAATAWQARSSGAVMVSGAAMDMEVRSFFVSGPESEGDYTFRCRFVRERRFNSDGVISAPFGVAVRFRDVKNYYGIVFRPSGEVVVERVHDGATHLVARAPAYAPQEAGNHLDVTARKDTITVRLNGHVALRVKDQAHVAGRAGLLVGGEERIRFHDVALYHPGAMPLEAVPLLMVKMPYILWAAGGRAVVMWETSRPSPASITYGIQGQPEEYTVHAPANTRVQRVVLDGLQPGRPYVYRLSIEGRNRGGGAFHTDAGGQAFTAALAGNTWAHPGRVEAIFAGMLAHAPHLAVHLGNMAGRGNQEDAWDTFFFTPGRQLLGRVPVYAAIGARDQWPDRQDFNRLFPYPGSGIETGPAGKSSYYAFHYGDAALLFLDSYFPHTEGSLQYAWAEAKLASEAFQEAKWRIVFSHAGPYRVERGRWTPGSAPMREDLLPMLARHGVQLWVAGESPTYKRGRAEGVTLVMNGGGGSGITGFGERSIPRFFDRVLGHVKLQYSIMRVGAHQIDWTCYTPGGAVIDHFVLEHPAPAATLQPALMLPGD